MSVVNWKEVVERAKLVQAGHSRLLVEDARFFAEYVIEEDQRREALLLSSREFAVVPNTEGGVTVSHTIRGKIVHTPGMGIIEDDAESDESEGS